MRGLYAAVKLRASAKKTLVFEVFGRHPSDQCRALNYFICHIYDNLQCSLMERLAVAIEENRGVGENVQRIFSDGSPSTVCLL